MWEGRDKHKIRIPARRPAKNDAGRQQTGADGFYRPYPVPHQPLRNGLMQARLDEGTDITALMAELDGHNSRSRPGK